METLETPIKTTRSSSKGYKQRWTVLALKHSHLIHPNLNFSKSPPNQSSAQVPNTLASRRDAARGGRTPNLHRFVAKQGSPASPAHEPAECREAACSPAERRVPLIGLPIRLNKYKNNDYTSNFWTRELIATPSSLHCDVIILELICYNWFVMHQRIAYQFSTCKQFETLVCLIYCRMVLWKENVILKQTLNTQVVMTTLHQLMCM